MTIGQTMKPVISPVLQDDRTARRKPSPPDKARQAALKKQIGSIVALALERLQALRAAVDRYDNAAKGFDDRFAKAIAEANKSVDALAKRLKKSETDRAALERKVGAHPDLAKQCQSAQAPHRRLFEAMHDFEPEASRFQEIPARFPLVGQSFTKLATIPELGDRRPDIDRVVTDLGKLAKLAQALAGARTVSAYRAKMGAASGFTTPGTTVKEIALGAIGKRYTDLATLHEKATAQAQYIPRTMTPLFDDITHLAERLL
jgi:hypothetical protein